ncbi:reverse transcriptase, partial [Clarias magur]
LTDQDAFTHTAEADLPETSPTHLSHCPALVNSATPAALSSAYIFSHSPQETGRGGGTALLLSKRWSFSPIDLSHHSFSSFEFHAVK